MSTRMRLSYLTAIVLSVLFCVSLHTVYAQTSAAVNDQAVIAKVGDWTMTLKEFNDYVALIQESLPPDATISLADKQQLLDQMVEQQLLVQEAIKQGLDKDKDILFALEEFKKTLLAQRVAAEALKDVDVSDDDAKAFYDQYQQEILSPMEWRIAQIVVPTEAEANKLVVSLTQGAEFSDLAKQHSQHASASKGGDLGFVQEFAFDKLGQKVLALDPGETSGAFQGPDGYYIVKLLGKRGGQVMSFEEVKEDIKMMLLPETQQKEYINYLENLQKSMTVEVKPELLEETK